MGISFNNSDNSKKDFNGNLIGNKIIGYCHYSGHEGYISEDLLKQHKCLEKNCKLLEKNEKHRYWDPNKNEDIIIQYRNALYKELKAEIIDNKKYDSLKNIHDIKFIKTYLLNRHKTINEIELQKRNDVKPSIRLKLFTYFRDLFTKLEHNEWSRLKNLQRKETK